ncbi:MAG: 2-C-methyl-D-erythritol 4-phosphate cytidylyltransferase, partial [Lachnospiraceae bacterium]|nr:2-C-methyl-D-erythritol 4-phosphate cytidylyltransferase [Lachnospiraceae bacterium]
MRRGEISVNEPRFTAICLAAGRGSRMESDTQKQYLLLREKPMLYYSLKAFQESFVDSVVLVTGKGEEEYCRRRIVESYGFDKVKAIVAGGRERYHSVYHGLAAVGESEYVFIHDSARPFLTQEILLRTKEGVTEHGACVVG